MDIYKPNITSTARNGLPAILGSLENWVNLIKPQFYAIPFLLENTTAVLIICFITLDVLYRYYK